MHEWQMHAFACINKYMCMNEYIHTGLPVISARVAQEPATRSAALINAKDIFQRRHDSKQGIKFHNISIAQMPVSNSMRNSGHNAADRM